MQFYWTYNGCNSADQAALAAASRHRQAELDAKAGLMGGDRRTPLVVRVARDPVPPQWCMQAALFAPRGRVQAEARSDEMLDALDRLIGELSEQIESQTQAAFAKQVEAARSQRRSLDGIVPMLETFYPRGMNDAFALVLLPVLESLNAYTLRELHTRGALGEIRSRQASLSNVMHNVLMRAWNEFEYRPREQAIDAWLVGFIEQALEELSETNAGPAFTEPEAASTPVPAFRSPRTAAAPASVAKPPDSTRASDVLSPRAAPSTHSPLPDSQKFAAVERDVDAEWKALQNLIDLRPDVTAGDQLDFAGRQVRLDRLLQRLPRQQRHVLMLHAVDGFSESEIADLQQRSPKAVSDDLRAARQEVRQMFTAADYADIEEQLTLKDLQRPRRAHRT